LLDAKSKPSIDVFQLTDEEIPSSHIYMEAQIFTPDSNRLVLHRSAHPHGSRQDDPEHRYLLCDLENQWELSPLTDEVGVTGALSNGVNQFTILCERYNLNELGTGGLMGPVVLYREK
jgi:hypothetical protein